MRGQVGGVNSPTTDLDRVGGKADQLVGLIQQKYGYTRKHAEEKFNRRLREAKADH